jgi:hypothetical protein
MRRNDQIGVIWKITHSYILQIVGSHMIVYVVHQILAEDQAILLRNEKVKNSYR